MDQKDKYILKRDEAASTRLTAQHHILKERQGYLLHPKIVNHLKTLTEPRIADLACGNGIWTIDITQQFKQAHVVGMDLSTDQFPPEWTYSPRSSKSRLSFIQQNLLEPFPEHLLGTFDVVHCKHFVSTIPPIPDLTLMLRQFHSLLRPGGFVQWVEPTWPTAGKVTYSDVTDLRLDLHENSHNAAMLPQADVINVTERMMQVATRMKFTSNFPVFLTSVPGLFTEAVMDMPVIIPELLAIETTTWMMNWEEFLTTIETRNGDDSDAYKECFESYQTDREYVHGGGLLTYVMAIGVARRI